jgi:hypothetical protein
MMYRHEPETPDTVIPPPQRRIIMIEKIKKLGIVIPVIMGMVLMLGSCFPNF